MKSGEVSHQMLLCFFLIIPNMQKSVRKRVN
jgi:hypothetical protein